ncbi:transcriptional coactivator YAP1-like isoform X2 [Babylonia areolata]|uniref:transcriptional coactivator YAP1-like isoform X2 n=1 Tax=Babylonia areolata TaxID=304850 RepID=UPI003FD63B73
MSQERASSHVLHVRENSASEMEALFKVVDPHSQDANKSIPFRDRNLPASFFRQPGLNQTGVPKGGPETQGYGDVGPISHMRAHSSPASLQQTLSAAPPPPTHQHHRQHSCELLDEPLPPGWGMARTPQGQSHLLQTTTWQDPRKSHSPNSLGSPQQPGSPASGTQTPPGPVDVSKLPLPHGWERAYTPEGEMYFINHVDRTTSWFHPSLSPQQQQRVGLRAQQAAAPSMQPSPQQPPMCSPVSAATSTPGAVGGVQRGPTSAEQQRQMKLKQLQMEKEMLMKRQEELTRQSAPCVQELMIRKGVPGAEAVDQATEMTTVADPFLGQTGSNTDHSRQESADSGLGGMGTSYNLPRTPEDFLSNMEEMDIHDGGPKVQGQSDFGSMDIASVGDASDSHNMDSEDLVPSLQEDIISSELLKDVENVLNSNKVDNLLTWL